MKKTITYLGVEKITYEFTKDEVEKAVMKYFDISWSRERDFEMFETYEDSPSGAKLVVKYTRSEDGEIE